MAQDPGGAEALAIEQLDATSAALSGAGPALEPTDELRWLALALPDLRGSDRRRARALLARPPSNDGSTEGYGGEWPCPEDNTINNCAETEESDHFVVHWPDLLTCDAPTQGCDEPDLTDDSPDNGVPDYVDQVLAAAEASYDVQNADLGWPLPKPDGSKGGNAKVDIYLADICAENGGACVFGYANTDDSSEPCFNPPYRCFAYLVLDNDYQVNEFGYTDPGEPLRVTMAHEYNHILQFNLDTNQDSWMFESTAVWSEHKVFPSDDDWVKSYIPTWAQTSQLPITRRSAGRGLRIYGSGVWNHWLDARFGPETILKAWQASRTTSPKDYAVGAYDAAIRDAGPGYGFTRSFTRFAATTSEWRSGVGGFPRSNELKNIRREGMLALNARRKRLTLDNTAYRLLRVNPRSADEIKLRIMAPRGVKAGIALVARKGSAVAPSAVVRRVRQIRNGRASVRLTGAHAYNRITAVVVNADGRVSGGKGFGEFSYSKDEQEFTAKLRRPRTRP